jgi:hypothetical protein
MVGILAPLYAAREADRSPPMRPRVLLTAIACCVIAACDDAEPIGPAQDVGDASLRFVNAFGATVDVLVDGVLHEVGVANGALTMISIDAGVRSVSVRSAGASSTAATVQLADGGVAGVAAVRAGGGAIRVETLDDTNAVVPAGATKLRVLHLAALSGEVQVWRTQPDFQTPTRWAFPFTYNTVKTYFQSTPGRWEVRVWTDTSAFRPGDPGGWAVATAITSVTWAAGQKKTVVIMDRPGGGLRLEQID